MPARNPAASSSCVAPVIRLSVPLCGNKQQGEKLSKHSLSPLQRRWVTTTSWKAESPENTGLRGYPLPYSHGRVAQSLPSALISFLVGNPCCPSPYYSLEVALLLPEGRKAGGRLQWPFIKGTGSSRKELRGRGCLFSFLPSFFLRPICLILGSHNFLARSLAARKRAMLK